MTKINIDATPLGRKRPIKIDPKTELVIKSFDISEDLQKYDISKIDFDKEDAMEKFHLYNQKVIKIKRDFVEEVIGDQVSTDEINKDVRVMYKIFFNIIYMLQNPWRDEDGETEKESKSGEDKS